MNKNNLGKVILKIFKTYYPRDNINLGEEQINNILLKANINHKNIKKEEIVKIIKIIKHHIEMGKFDNEKLKNPVVKPIYEPIFRNLENDKMYAWIMGIASLNFSLVIESIGFL